MRCLSFASAQFLQNVQEPDLCMNEEIFLSAAYSLALERDRVSILLLQYPRAKFKIELQLAYD